MKLLFSIVAMLLLVGCASLVPHQIHPDLGEDFNSVNKKSNDAGTGDLVDISSSIKGNQGYDNYTFYRAFQRNFIDHSLLQPYNPLSDILVFKQDKLVLISRDGNTLAKDIAPLKEKDRQLTYYGADYDLAIKYSKDFGVLPTRENISQMQAYGVKSISDLDAAEEDFKKYSYLYNKLELTTYLQDKATAKGKTRTIDQAAQARKAGEERAAQQREKEAARERAVAEANAARNRAEHAKEYPFEAVISCGGMAGSQTALCFVGEHDVNTELELTNGEQYHMYQAFDVNTLVREILAQGTSDTNEGLVIPLRKHFSLKVQNAQANMLLTVVIRDTKTHKVVFQKSAAHFSSIAVKN